MGHLTTLKNSKSVSSIRGGDATRPEKNKSSHRLLRFKLSEFCSKVFKQSALLFIKGQMKLFTGSIEPDFRGYIAFTLRLSFVLLPLILHKITEDKRTKNGRTTEDERRMAKHINHKSRTNPYLPIPTQHLSRPPNQPENHHLPDISLNFMKPLNTTNHHLFTTLSVI